MRTETMIHTGDGVLLHVVAEGPEDGAPLLLSNSLGTDLTMWEPQIAVLASKFRVVRYDTRGHGKSDSPQGDYSIALLAQDALAVARAQGWESFNFAGVSMGGMTGLWLAANAADSIQRARVANCAPFAGGAAVWGERMKLVAEKGMDAITEMVVARWFSPEFAARNPDIIADISARFRATSPAGYLGCCAALREMDLRPDLARIDRPVRVVGGEHDPTPPATAIPGIAGAIAGADWTIINAAHLSNIEDAEGFSSALLDFLR
jgi:3-oxoadipate enol-lactonase